MATCLLDSWFHLPKVLRISLVRESEGSGRCGKYFNNLKLEESGVIVSTRIYR